VSFAGPVRELIHLFKYERKMHLRRPLGLLTARILAGFATSSTPDLLIPVPLHSKRLRQRSFNQALLLAELLGKSWQIPVCRRGMVRSRWTEPQINLSAAQRAANVRDAFIVAMPEEISGRRVMLVDDVYTTGCTVAECARVLRAAGATAVFVVTTARATPWG
jgi:ComF family protein